MLISAQWNFIEIFAWKSSFFGTFLVRNITLISVGYYRVIVILNVILADILFTLLVWNLGQASTIATLEEFVIKMKTILLA